MPPRASTSSNIQTSSKSTGTKSGTGKRTKDKVRCDCGKHDPGTLVDRKTRVRHQRARDQQLRAMAAANDLSRARNEGYHSEEELELDDILKAEIESVEEDIGSLDMDVDHDGHGQDSDEEARRGSGGEVTAEDTGDNGGNAAGYHTEGELLYPSILDPSILDPY
jgi:hypothetical protein